MSSNIRQFLLCYAFYCCIASLTISSLCTALKLTPQPIVPLAVTDRRQALITSATCGLTILSPTKNNNKAWADDGPKIDPITTLSDGKTKFPLASFGLQIYNDNTAYDLTLTALEVGYRNFFASVLAGNQKGFAKAVRDSGIPRKDLFICGSVVSNRAGSFDAAKKETTNGWKRNMDAFSVGNIDYLDQIMLDYPGPNCDSILGKPLRYVRSQNMKNQNLAHISIS